MNGPDAPDGPRPPGFEPPTDVNVPWYAWMLWPAALLLGLGLVMLAFRSCLRAVN
jgi:hypothetical protein